MKALTSDRLAEVRDWSFRTFGPTDARTEGIVDHIIRELIEIAGPFPALRSIANAVDWDNLDTDATLAAFGHRASVAHPDPSEFVDVVILGFDGLLRAGYEPETIFDLIDEKWNRNMARKWPDWRTAEPGRAIEHIRET